MAELTEAGNRVQLESGADLFFAESYGGPDSLSHQADITLAGIRFKECPEGR
jgi:hypothetical protein